MPYHPRGDARMAFADRLREERQRLKLSQTALASHALIKKQTQLKYESGETSPPVSYLYWVEQQGVDIVYLLTGERIASSEDSLLYYYRRASEELQKAALAVLQSNGTPPMGIEAEGGVHIAGDQLGNVNTGTQTTHGPMTFNVGREKKGQGK